MSREKIHNAQVYNSEGRRVYQGNLYDTLPAALRDGTCYVLSQWKGDADTFPLEQMKARKIATIVNGKLRIDADEWLRNYGGTP